MRRFYFLLVIFIVSCTNNVENLSSKLVSSCSFFESNNTINISDFLTSQYMIDPKDIRLTKEGIFITVSSFFVEEKGVYILIDKNFDLFSVGDPSFNLVDECIYTYEIKG